MLVSLIVHIDCSRLVWFMAAANTSTATIQLAELLYLAILSLEHNMYSNSYFVVKIKIYYLIERNNSIRNTTSNIVVAASQSAKSF